MLWIEGLSPTYLVIYDRAENALTSDFGIYSYRGYSLTSRIWAGLFVWVAKEASAAVLAAGSLLGDLRIGEDGGVGRRSERLFCWFRW